MQVSEHTAEALPPKGPCLVQVHYTVSVDVRSGQSEHRLYGFATEAERHLFRQLIDVQGREQHPGPGHPERAEAGRVRSAILAGDVALLKGIGASVRSWPSASCRSSVDAWGGAVGRVRRWKCHGRQYAEVGGVIRTDLAGS